MLPKILSLFCSLILISLATCSSVPALIWSPHRSLSDLPDVFAGHAVSTDDFQNRYLKPLSKLEVSALVIFVQDRLSLDDFSHYADVYNQESDGGAFHNVKDFMDEQFSVQLPSVESPVSAIETVRKTYSGVVHDLEAPHDVNQLTLNEEKGNLIIVHLPKVNPASPQKSIAKNDELIGHVLSSLSKKQVKYTAIYTAQSASQESSQSLKYSGRRLLEDAPAPSNTGYNQSIFANGTCGMLFASKIQMMVGQGGDKIIANLDKLISYDLPCENASATWTLYFDTPANTSLKDVKLWFNFTTKPMTQGMDWYISQLKLEFNGKFGNESDGPTSLELNAEDIWAPKGLSYHCGQPDVIRVSNSSLSNITLLFTKLQIQPLGLRNGKFGLPWDCVGFFTAPIWMALFTILILLIILAYGLWMILSINVMDRFDDAKGKTITVNAGE